MCLLSLHFTWVRVYSVITMFSYNLFKGDILWKQHFSWDLGCCFGSLVLPHAYKLWKKSVHDFLSEICISERTPPTVTKRASPFWRPLLRRKGVQFNITSHFPTPLQSEHSKDFVDQRTSSSGGGISAAAQLREYNPFLCRTVAELHPPELRDCRQSFSGSPEEETWRRKGFYSRSWAAGLPPSYPRRTCQLPEDTSWSSRKALAAVQLPEYGNPAAVEAGGSPAAQARVARRQFGSSAPLIQSLTCCERARDVRRSICDS
jgi:hypothetical protein